MSELDITVTCICLSPSGASQSDGYAVITVNDFFPHHCTASLFSSLCLAVFLCAHTHT